MSWQRSLVKLLAASIGKKIIVFGIIKVCSLAGYQVQAYGIPHVYRRALEINKKVFKKPETRKFTANLIKQGILLPNTISAKFGLPQRPVKTFPNSTLPIKNSSSTSNTVATPYTPSRLVTPSHPNLPTGSIKNPTTSTPITQTTTTTTSNSPASSSSSKSTKEPKEHQK